MRKTEEELRDQEARIREQYGIVDEADVVGDEDLEMEEELQDDNL